MRNPTRLLRQACAFPSGWSQGPRRHRRFECRCCRRRLSHPPVRCRGPLARPQPPRVLSGTYAKRFADRHGYAKVSLWPFDTEDEINGNTGQYIRYSPDRAPLAISAKTIRCCAACSSARRRPPRQDATRCRSCPPRRSTAWAECMARTRTATALRYASLAPAVAIDPRRADTQTADRRSRASCAHDRAAAVS